MVHGRKTRSNGPKLMLRDAETEYRDKCFHHEDSQALQQVPREVVQSCWRFLMPGWIKP